MRRTELGPEVLSDAELLSLVLGAARELERRRGSEAPSAAPTAGASAPRPLLDSPERAAALVPEAVRRARKEHLLAFCLDARGRLLRRETVSIGTLSASLVHPREVFAPAIAQSAAAIVVAHNHPSGDCAPSAEDKDATRRLARSGELLGIPLLDHLIVSEAGFFSFRQGGLMV